MQRGRDPGWPAAKRIAAQLVRDIGDPSISELHRGIGFCAQSEILLQHLIFRMTANHDIGGRVYELCNAWHKSLSRMRPSGMYARSYRTFGKKATRPYFDSFVFMLKKADAPHLRNNDWLASLHANTDDWDTSVVRRIAAFRAVRTMRHRSA